MGYVDEVLELVSKKNADQPEFLQAVTEVLNTLRPVVDANEELYRSNAILERITEPDRVLMLIDTNDTCIVEGDIELSDSGLVHLNHIKADITVRNGDKIVTSNISDKYLQGILIGYAKDVTADSNNLTQSGYLVPAVDFNNLQEVLIITEMKNQ